MKDQEIPVYSTEKKPQVKEKVSKSMGTGPFRVALEKKGRGGKQVTIISNLPMDDKEARDFMRALQQKFACGASLKDGCILLNGDFQKAVRDLPEAKNRKAP